MHAISNNNGAIARKLDPDVCAAEASSRLSRSGQRCVACIRRKLRLSDGSNAAAWNTS
jgi:hypothetical protein